MNSSEAYKLAEKLRVIIEKYRFPVIKSKTSSFGVASYRSGESIHDLTKRADEALYCAKKNGRNRVEVSDSSFGVVFDPV
jgi:diguanylate cyclase (GGDEF)-like protein